MYTLHANHNKTIYKLVNDETNRPFQKRPGYSCTCKVGFRGDGFTCKSIVEKLCPNDFWENLKKMKVTDVKRPATFVGERTAIIELQTQVKFLKE